MIPNKYTNITKTISAAIALLVGFLTVLVTALSDGTITTAEAIALFGSFGTLIGGTGAVYQFPNKEEK